MSTAEHVSGADASSFTHPLHGWPSAPPSGYLGQLDPAYQGWLAEQSGHVSFDDCEWYHSTELPDGTLKVGHWDLRGRESNYLGKLPLKNRSVLEFGPASGHLTSWMERQGAAVTCFEIGFDCKFDVMPPVDGTDLEALYPELMATIAKVNNSWWVQHELRKSSARIAYGDIYNLPADLGQYDISTFGAILLHLRDPFRALQQAAARTTEAIVVTELFHRGLEDEDDPVMRWGVKDWERGPSQIWWYFSPGSVTRMLWRLGFGRTAVIRHQQGYHAADQRAQEEEDDAQAYELFTVVATRSAHQMSLPHKAPTFTHRVRHKLERMARASK
jgi:O-methyltransferase